MPSKSNTQTPIPADLGPPRAVKADFTPFKLGDRVTIKYFREGEVGRIGELRGPLGPEGAPVYRVVYRRKPEDVEIEVLGRQLEHAPKAAPRRRKVAPKPAEG